MDTLTMFPVFYMASVFKTMGMALGGYDDQYLTLIGSLGSVANGLSRIMWGTMQDKTGFVAIYKVIIVVELVVFSLLPYIVEENKYLYLMAIFAGYLCLGAHFVIFPNCVIAIFGLRSSVQLSSFIYVTRCVSALSGMFISKALNDRLGDQTYSVMFWTSCVFILISAFLLIFLFDEKPIRRCK